MSDALLSASPSASHHPPLPAPLRRYSCGLNIVYLPRRIGARGPCSPLFTSFSLTRGSRKAAGSTTAWGGVEEDDAPASIELTPIASEEQFDKVVAEAQQLEELLIVLWMANWCRKCIYLKPKLEKLAAKYYPRTRFYCVDVNIVPQRLVTKAGITKMPTIQLWKDGQKQAEVIGGHKAWLVIDDVRRMIENED